MEIGSIRHRGLRRLIEDDDGRGIRSDQLNRIRNILTALIAAPAMDDLRGPASWRVHQLAGERAGTWSISVSGNWRVTFDIEEGRVERLDLEDYH